MLRALYGGSFDPVHLGHLSIVEQAARAFGELAVVVLANPDKASGALPRSVRADLVRQAVAHLVNVTVHEYQGLIVDAAQRLGCGVLVRSAHKETSAEMAMAAANGRMTGIPTTFVMPAAATAWISSTMVRDLVSTGRIGAVRDMVPEPVFHALERVAQQRSPRGTGAG